MFDWTFQNPEWLWALLLVPLYLLYYIFWQGKRSAKLPYNHAVVPVQEKATRTQVLVHLPVVFRVLTIIALCLAAARPQSALSWEEVETEGIDIVLSMDLSGSMLAMDLKPNRLEASKEVAKQFVSDRPNDRFGLVVYSAQGFTQCPLTTDHKVVRSLIDELQNGMIEDGTAIGEGLATAVNRLKDSEAKSKVVILLTDGYNNRGNVPPLTAAEIAKMFGVRVYTIGVGTNGMAPMKMQTPFGRTVTQNVEVKIDEPTLKEIAKITGGKYFRATDNASLKAIYEEIDASEKVKIAVTQYQEKTEEFSPFAWLALVLLLTEMILNNSWLKSIINC